MEPSSSFHSRKYDFGDDFRAARDGEILSFRPVVDSVHDLLGRSLWTGWVRLTARRLGIAVFDDTRMWAWSFVGVVVFCLFCWLCLCCSSFCEITIVT